MDAKGTMVGDASLVAARRVSAFMVNTTLHGSKVWVVKCSKQLTATRCMDCEACCTAASHGWCSMQGVCPGCS